MKRATIIIIIIETLHKSASSDNKEYALVVSERANIVPSTPVCDSFGSLNIGDNPHHAFVF